MTVLTEVVKRDGRRASFTGEKIRHAIFRCFHLGLEVERLRAEILTKEIYYRIVDRLNEMAEENISSLSVETIQDLVEEALMAAGHYLAARRYVLYREERRRQRSLSPVDPVEAERVARNRLYFATPAQEYTFYSKYSRWSDVEGRRETWEETVGRSVSFLHQRIGDRFIRAEWERIERAMLKQDALPSMRLLQMAGPAAERCNVSIYNCSYLPLADTDAFAELLYILMQGTGVGFSVEPEYIDRLPDIAPWTGEVVDRFVIPDSTVGWCDALKVGMHYWFQGLDVEFDVSGVRPQGARLKTKGGRASGPQPLMELLDYTRAKIAAKGTALGGRLLSRDAHDIACKAGWIVQVGGVRRAALISLSALNDKEMREAKSGQFWTTEPQRAMANNSAVYEEKPSAVSFMEEWLELAKSGSGERGIFNRGGVMNQIPERREKARFGTNPCAEIILRPYQFCNLTIAVARAGDTKETLEEKVHVAAMLGTAQSMLTDFQYIRPEWKRNCEEERLLGVDITGQMDCERLRPHAPLRNHLLSFLKETAITTNAVYAQRLGLSPSHCVTTVKPSGNSAQFLNCSSGIHPRYAKCYLRRMRAGAYDPLSRLLKDAGVPCHPENGSTWETAAVWVFEFPCRSPDGAITRHDMTAVDQMENWLTWKREYTEHNPSATIYVASDEWLKVGNWVYENWERIGGLSFHPKEDGDHVYTLAPYEEISEEECLRREAAFPVIDYSKLRRYELEDQTVASGEFACTSGACSL